MFKKSFLQHTDQIFLQRFDHSIITSRVLLFKRLDFNANNINLLYVAKQNDLGAKLGQFWLD